MEPEYRNFVIEYINGKKDICRAYDYTLRKGVMTFYTEHNPGSFQWTKLRVIPLEKIAWVTR